MPADQTQAIVNAHEGAVMDFIERIFGFSPDGGSGSFEMLLLLIPIVGIYLLYRMKWKSGKSK